MPSNLLHCCAPCAAASLPAPPGQQAADKIFESRQQKPLDKGKTAKGKATTKGKTTGSKRR
jgi:hypothetical protein